VRAHGTYAGYQAGCRDLCCVRAERQYQARRKRAIAYGRPLKVPSIGSVRRIQALMAAGWTGTYLAERLDVRRPNLPTHTRYPTIRAWKAKQIADLYDEVHMRAGPSERTRARAELHGFLPPEAWEGVDIDDPTALPVIDYDDEPFGEDIDEIAVERAIRGDRVPLNRAERREAVRVLTARGLTEAQIAGRLGTSVAVVCNSRGAA
jgi:hypothetical protein